MNIGLWIFGGVIPKPSVFTSGARDLPYA